MVLITLTGFNGNPGHITNPSPSRRSHPLNSMEQAIHRNTEETTSVDEFRRFSETNPELKGVEPVNHAPPCPSWAASHSLLGYFSVVESKWVTQRVHNPSR